MNRKINIRKDVESRKSIASRTSKQIVQPSNPITDAPSKEIQKSEAHKTPDESSSSPKRERKTKRNNEEV